MLEGKPTFTGKVEHQVFEQIKNLDYTCPEHFSFEAKDIIHKLLSKDPL